jgi:hypothetical protein
VVLAEDETHLNLLPHVRARWTLRGARPQNPTRGRTGRSSCSARSRATTGTWVYRKVTACLEKHPRLELLCGARHSPDGHPAERIWAALKNYVANTAAPWTSPWLLPGYEPNFWNAA